MKITKHVEKLGVLTSARTIEFTGLLPRIPGIPYNTIYEVYHQMQLELNHPRDTTEKDFEVKHRLSKDVYYIVARYVQKEQLQINGVFFPDIIYHVFIQKEHVLGHIIRTHDDDITREFLKRSKEDLKLGEPVIYLECRIHMQDQEQVDLNSICACINETFSTQCTAEDISEAFVNAEDDQPTYFLLGDEPRIFLFLENPDEHAVWEINLEENILSFTLTDHPLYDPLESLLVKPHDLLVGKPEMNLVIRIDRDDLPFYGRRLHETDILLQSLIDKLTLAL